MKIIQVSDTHLVPAGERPWGIDPRERLRACIAHINERHPDAALVVFTGDLANDGQREAYEILREELRALASPYRLMVGNHDDRAVFRSVFPDHDDGGAFIQGVEDRGDLRLVFLDTLDVGQVSGRMCAERLDWLDRRLSEAADRDVLVFMHHPPMSLDLPVLDTLRLADPDAFGEVVGRRGNVRHIFAGHVHRLVAGSWRGIPFTTLRSTAVQFGLDRSQTRLTKTLENAFYGIVLATRESVIVHFHDFMDASPRFD